MIMEYLIILLDDNSASYCHYSHHKGDPNPIPINTLHNGIIYAMKENLMVQFIYPEYPISSNIQNEIETIDHIKMIPASNPESEKADVFLYDSIGEFLCDDRCMNKICVVRTTKCDLFTKSLALSQGMFKVKRLNIVISDIETFTKEDFTKYHQTLNDFVKQLSMNSLNDRQIQLNLLTDRLMLENMNNCNAGIKSITLAPNGKFYICPAFYYEDINNSVGSLENGLNIKNQQLYRIDHAPICCHCEAYQCKRCVWLNKKTTLEVNTPSHEQCVVSHLERNASRLLMANMRKKSTFFSKKEIKEIDYLDPFDLHETFE